jgi:hypothetical protein
MRVSLRVAGLFVTGVAALFAIASCTYRGRREAAETIVAKNGRIYFDEDDPQPWHRGTVIDRNHITFHSPFPNNVRRIVISDVELDARLVSAIAKLTETRNVTIARSKVSLEVCDALASMPCLAELVISDCEIECGAFKPFADNHTLRSCNLLFSRLSDDDCACLAQCDSLTEVQLNGTNVTDSGLLSFATSPRLAAVFVSRGPITKQGIEQLLSTRQWQRFDMPATI